MQLHLNKNFNMKQTIYIQYENKKYPVIITSATDKTEKNIELYIYFVRLQI